MYSLQVYVHQIYFLLKKEKWDLRILQPLKQQSHAILVYLSKFIFIFWVCGLNDITYIYYAPI
jgi:hypothetical protein